MRAFMDHHEQRVIGKGSQKIGSADNDPPGTVPYEPGHEHLEKHQAQNRKDGILVLPDEFPHFRMLLQDLPGTDSMRFRISGINKVGSFCHSPSLEVVVSR